MGPVKKLNCLNDSGPTKPVKVLTYIRTKTSFLGPFELFIFYKKILHALKAVKALKAQKHNQAKAQNANKRVTFFLLDVFYVHFFCLL